MGIFLGVVLVSLQSHFAEDTGRHAHGMARQMHSHGKKTTLSIVTLQPANRALWPG